MPDHDKPLRPDEPIHRLADDWLDRGRLVETIANHILAAPTGQAVTIGLNAPWGAGKSSFLNLLYQHLKKEPVVPHNHSPAQPIVIRFNPWIFGSVDQLTVMFFADLARALGVRDAKVGRQLESFGKLLALASAVMPPGGPAELTKSLGETTTLLGTQIKSAHESRSLEARKVEIEELLKPLRQRIVIFIDDVDRLEPDLTTFLFRMVRLNANFPNIVYVLAFDRTVVEKHLAHDSPAYGREYFEKIIQVSYDLPKPRPRVLRHILMSELADVRRAIETTELNELRYDQVFQAKFATHFRTVRSIKRYVNALRLTLPPVAGEVDLVDFYIIELIRLAYPDLYLSIEQEEASLLRPRHDEKDAGNINQWIARLSERGVPPHLHASMRGLLCILFPGLRAMFPDDLKDIVGIDTGPYNQAAILRWGGEGRVCSDGAFGKFFSLTGRKAKSDVASRDADVPMKADTIREHLRRAAKIGEINEAIAQLEERVTRAQIKSDDEEGRAEEERASSQRLAGAVAKAVCASDPRDDFLLGDEPRQYRMLTDVVAECVKVVRQDEKHRFLSTLMDNSQREFVFTLSKVFEGIDDLDSTVGTDGADLLRQKLVRKIEEAAGHEEFWLGGRWHYLLRRTEELAGVKRVRRVVEMRIEEVGLLGFCEAFYRITRNQKARGGDVGGDIDEWLPGGKIKLESRYGEGDRAERARDLVERVWGA